MIRTFAVALSLLVSTAALAEEAKTDAAAKPAAAAPTAAPAATVEAKTFVYEPKDTDVVYGSDNAPLTLVEYASLSCSHCSAFYREVFPELKTKYIDTGKVKLVYRNYPLNQPALEAAQMVQCADKDARPAYLKVLFNTQEKWAYDSTFRESLAGIAVLGGMDRKKFDECLKNNDIQAAILLVYQEARDAYKVTSTPSLFLGSQQIKGNHNFASVSKALDDALAAAPKK